MIAVVSMLQGQTPRLPPPQTPEPDEVIRISSELVQTDVVVTDKNDRVIKDLKIDDFELYENGKRQEIKFLEFVGVDSKPRVEGSRPALPASVAEATAPVGVSAKELRRVFAFVVDDLTMPYQELPYVRQMLTNFVDDQMREGDLVAIVRVYGGRGLLQQFTTDKQLLRRAIASIRPVHNPNSEYENVPFDNSFTLSGASSSAGNMAASDVNPSSLIGFDVNNTLDATQQALRGTIQLETVNYVIDSLREVSGHKSLVLISGGLPLLDINSTGTVSSTISRLIQLLSNSAARAGVTINTLDVRGLNAVRSVARFQDTPGRSSMGAYNPNFGRGGGDIATFGNSSPFAISNGQLGLQTLASATGGVAVQNTNDFQTALK
jgi:VWFA-related protein